MVARINTFGASDSNTQEDSMQDSIMVADGIEGMDNGQALAALEAQAAAELKANPGITREVEADEEGIYDSIVAEELAWNMRADDRVLRLHDTKLPRKVVVAGLSPFIQKVILPAEASVFMKLGKIALEGKRPITMVENGKYLKVRRQKPSFSKTGKKFFRYTYFALQGHTVYVGYPNEDGKSFVDFDFVAPSRTDMLKRDKEFGVAFEKEIPSDQKVLLYWLNKYTNTAEWAKWQKMGLTEFITAEPYDGYTQAWKDLGIALQEGKWYRFAGQLWHQANMPMPAVGDKTFEECLAPVVSGHKVRILTPNGKELKLNRPGHTQPINYSSPVVDCTSVHQLIKMWYDWTKTRVAAEDIAGMMATLHVEFDGIDGASF